MDVTNYDAAGVGTTTTNVPWPVNGVLYVKNNGACDGEYPDRRQVRRAGHLRQRLRQRHLHASRSRSRRPTT